MKKLIATLGITLSVFSAAAFAEADIEKRYDHVDLVMVLDKSGSMHGMESDTIGGFNSLLDKQRRLDVKTDVTTAIFNQNTRYIHERKSLDEIRNLTDEDYRPEGSTALLDSVGMTIDKVANYYSVNDKKNKVVFAIITDGLENASHEYSKQNVKKLIEQKKESGWEFIFLGANIDAVAEASSIGISSDRAIKYKATNQGVRKNFDAISTFAAEAVSSDSVSNSWKEKADLDK